MELDKLIQEVRYVSLNLPWIEIKQNADAVITRTVETLKAQQTRIAQLEAELKEERRLIPVEERLPDLVPCGAGTAYSEAVNILTSGRKVLTAIWDGTEFITDAEFWEAEGEVITHWTPVLLPLPKRPEADG